MSKFNYDGRTFVGVENYDSGDLNAQTVFRYYQRGDIVWGSFEGGGCAAGNLIARVGEDGSLNMSWHYLNRSGDLLRGTCRSRLEVLPDGRYRLHESWEISDGTTGTSVIEETKRD